MRESVKNKISLFLSEVLGTAILMCIGCMGCLNNEKLFPNTHFQASLNFGLAVLVAIQCVGCISGAHINPSVTIAAFIYRKINVTMAVIYICAQMIGSCIGYGLLKAAIPQYLMTIATDSHGFCVTSIHPEISILQALAIEFIITSCLVLVCCAVWDPRNSINTDSIPTRFGLVIACLCFSGGSMTGASMNPARSFGPALWNGNLFDTDHWIYWVGPLSGSVLATALYRAVFYPGVPDEIPQ